MKETAIYVPDKSIREGYIALWKEMIREIKDNRWLILQLFLRDIKSNYKQSLIGLFWTLIIPFFALGTFIILNSSGIISIGEIEVPYPIFAILGLSYWQIFSTGITTSTNSLTNAGSMISKINFPREALVIASIGQALIAFLIQIAVAFGLFIYYDFSPSWMIIIIPLASIPILLFTLGLGFIFSIINGIVRDLGKILGTLVSLLLFLTPILYAAPKFGILKSITRYNPLYYLITVPRDLALNSTLNEPSGYLYSVILSVVLFIFCWMAFHLTETRLAERV